MNVQLFLKRNSSTILTCVGAVGVAATAIMAVKATPKAITLLENAKKEKGEKLSKWETVKTAGPVYIPSVLTGVATVACIFGADVLNKRQQAALVSAYALLDQSYKNYKTKVDELYGKEAGEKVRESIAKDEYEEQKEEIVQTEGSDKQLFYDFYSGRYFESTIADVIWAEYEVNRALATYGGIGLNEFYNLLDLEELPEYSEIGWSAGQISETYWEYWIDFDHEKTTIDDDLECTIIHMPLEPLMGYLDY